MGNWSGAFRTGWVLACCLAVTATTWGQEQTTKDEATAVSKLVNAVNKKFANRGSGTRVTVDDSVLVFHLEDANSGLVDMLNSLVGDTGSEKSVYCGIVTNLLDDDEKELAARAEVSEVKVAEISAICPLPPTRATKAIRP